MSSQSMHFSTDMMHCSHIPCGTFYWHALCTWGSNTANNIFATDSKLETMPKKACMWIISGLFPQNCAGETADSNSALHCPYVQTSCHLKTSCSTRPLPPNDHNDNPGCRWAGSQQRRPAHSTPLITSHLPSRLCHRWLRHSLKNWQKRVRFR